MAVAQFLHVVLFSSNAEKHSFILGLMEIFI